MPSLHFPNFYLFPRKVDVLYASHLWKSETGEMRTAVFTFAASLQSCRGHSLWRQDLPFSTSLVSSADHMLSRSSLDDCSQHKREFSLDLFALRGPVTKFLR